LERRFQLVQRVRRSFDHDVIEARLESVNQIELSEPASASAHVAKYWGRKTYIALNRSRGSPLVEAFGGEVAPPRAVAISSLLLNAIRIIESQLPCAVRLSSDNVCGGAGPHLSLA
jgi:hypothetical protein